MTIFRLLVLAAAATQDEPARPPARPAASERKVELRVTFFTPSPPAKPAADRKEPGPEELALLLAVTSPPNKSRTYVLTRVLLKEGETAPDATPGQVRKLEGTPYFARLVVVGAEPAGGRKENGKAPKEPAPEVDGVEEPTPPKQDGPGQVLRRVYFKLETKAEDFPKEFKASLTLRAGVQTFTARTFAYPFLGHEGAAADRIDSALKDIVTAMDTTAFGKIPTITVRIEEDLEELAAVAAQDAKGDKEYDRQWCLAVCKRIERASYTGDDDVRSLVQQFQNRLRRFREVPSSGLKPPEAPPKEPPPELPKEK